MGGGDDGLIMSRLQSKMNARKATASKITMVNDGFNNIMATNKGTPGFNTKNFEKNFVNHFTTTKDAQGNSIPVSVNDLIKTGDPNVINHFATIINESDDNWDTDGFKNVFQKANPNREQKRFTKILSNGQTDETFSSLQLPLDLYAFKDDKPYLIGDDVPVTDQKTADVMHNLLQDGQTGTTIYALPKASLDAYVNTNEGIKGYIDQEKNKFAKAAEAAGVTTKDSNGTYTLDFQNKMDDYGRAVGYKVFDEIGKTVGGFSTQSGVVQKAAPIPKKGMTVNINTEQEGVETGSFDEALNELTPDAEGFRSVKPQFAGLKDALTLSYGFYDDLQVGYKDGKWMMRIINSDGSKDVSLAQFISSAGTTDSKEKRQQLRRLKNWTKKHTPGKAD